MPLPATTATPVASSATAVQEASLREMISSLEELKASAFPNKEWLTKNNRYIHDIIGTYKIDLGTSRTYHKFLKDYTATSSILHCSDAWTFISRAVGSLIDGDVSSAIFFTYYSELRSLMSMFATNGISILNNKHIFINSRGKAVRFGKIGTHDQVDQVLTDFIADPLKGDLLLEWLRVDNNTLKDWVRATGTLSSGYLAQDWLQKWSVDVKQLEFDHDTRNEVSYRPHKLKNELYNFSYQDNLTKILSFWELCEPTQLNNFHLLDKHLLRLSLQAIFDNKPYRLTSSNGRRDKNSKSYKSAFKRFIIRASDNLASKPSLSLLKFLSREDSPEDSDLIKEARRPAFDKATKQYDVIPMLARALMLLRISTAGCEYLLKEAGVNKTDLEFWWSDVGNKNGFWKNGVLPNDFKDDLWPDISASLSNIRLYCIDHQVYNLQDLNGVAIEDLSRFRQLNQIPLWGLGL
jgi:hypothetical protein